MAEKKKAMTVRLEETFYKKVMKMLIEKDVSFQEYVIKLIEEDMKK